MAEEKKPEAAPADAAAPAADGAEGAPKKKKKLILFGGIGVGVIAVGLGAFFMMKPKKELSAKAPEHSESDAKDDKAASAEKKEDAPASAEKKEEGKGDAAADAKKKDDAAAGTEKKDDSAAGAAKKDDSAAGAASKYGEVFSLPHQDLNLGNPIENRYLRITIGLEYRGGEEQAEELKRRQAQFTDIMISTISNKTRLELLTEIGKNKLRRELLNKFNEISERPLSAIYFTEFVVE